jgi:hypothetical protein
MPEPNITPQRVPNAWHNGLPVWIARSEEFRELTRRHRTFERVLQAIADHCDPPGPDGSLMGAYGSGRMFADAANISVAQFWRSATALEDAGYLVPLGIGGPVRLGGRTINAGNAYGIPGHAGALDHRRVKRERRVVRPDLEGQPRHVVLEPGAQATLWARVNTDPQSDVQPSRPRRSATANRDRTAPEQNTLWPSGTTAPQSGPDTHFRTEQSTNVDPLPLSHHETPPCLTMRHYHTHSTIP